MITRELKIIVADDHTLVREGLIKVMEKNQRVTEVKGASDGKEVLALLKTFACDLILMDLDMPVMDGIDTSAEVLKKYPEVRILVLSGYSEDKYIYHLIEMGVHGYLTKNATPQELVCQWVCGCRRDKWWFDNDSSHRTCRCLATRV